jgi:chemotaxis protein MotB
MSFAGAEEGQPRHEIIIVRRSHDDHDEGHHGGVWKIAFADFMTAMMCFFLVMWLINAANDQTKAAVASYFNPIKLVDRNASRKGLDEMGQGPADDPQEDAPQAAKQGKGNAGSANEKNTRKQISGPPSLSPDEKLFDDPYAVLAEIASDTGVMQNVSAKGDGGANEAGPATGASGGKSYRDPFAPDFWSQQVATPRAEASAEREKIEGDPPKPGDKIAETEVPEVKAAPPTPQSASLEAPAGTAVAGSAKEGEAAAAAAGPDQAEEAQQPAPAAAIKAAAEMKARIAEAFKPGDRLHDGVSVEATDKGVVISITDQLDFGMFEIGSALPRRELVLAMEKIGRILNDQKGAITIQGHTDARPFRGDHYDNWRLSTARAHSAYYMLVRGGVDERRIKEVAGFADRQPKDKADPLAAVNRRIEILLETGG